MVWSSGCFFLVRGVQGLGFSTLKGFFDVRLGYVFHQHTGRKATQAMLHVSGSSEKPYLNAIQGVNLFCRTPP